MGRTRHEVSCIREGRDYRAGRAVSAASQADGMRKTLALWRANSKQSRFPPVHEPCNADIAARTGPADRRGATLSSQGVRANESCETEDDSSQEDRPKEETQGSQKKESFNRRQDRPN